MAKLLTIAVPCFNSESYMRKCIESILAGGERVELIIIDDGSSDNTGHIADEYADMHPKVVKVIHQRNLGHGEGINQGIKHAEGIYFRVVDSDDWVGEAELVALLDWLEQYAMQDSLDMVVCNYVYEYTEQRKSKTVGYGNVFPENDTVGWEETRPFLEHQYLTIHSVAFNTSLLRSCELEMPQHVFYEDNLFVYKPLPLVKRIVYLNLDFYHYQIGREGQSVAEDKLKERYEHQIKIATLIFKSHNIQKVICKNKKLGRYMYHEAKMMLIMATAFARLNKTAEAEYNVRRMWDDVIDFDPVVGKKIRCYSEAALLNKPGRVGRAMSVLLYRFAHRIIRFN